MSEIDLDALESIAERTPLAACVPIARPDALELIALARRAAMNPGLRPTTTPDHKWSFERMMTDRDYWKARAEAAERQAAAYREALERIADMPYIFGMPDARRAARSALASPIEEKAR